MTPAPTVHRYLVNAETVCDRGFARDHVMAAGRRRTGAPTRRRIIENVGPSTLDAATMTGPVEYVNIPSQIAAVGCILKAPRMSLTRSLPPAQSSRPHSTISGDRRRSDFSCGVRAYTERSRRSVDGLTHRGPGPEALTAWAGVQRSAQSSVFGLPPRRRDEHSHRLNGPGPPGARSVPDDEVRRAAHRRARAHERRTRPGPASRPASP